jgi:hypothetical protein
MMEAKALWLVATCADVWSVRAQLSGVGRVAGLGFRVDFSRKLPGKASVATVGQQVVA